MIKYFSDTLPHHIGALVMALVFGIGIRGPVNPGIEPSLNDGLSSFLLFQGLIFIVWYRKYKKE